jgi:hypothetical protein
MHFAHYMPRILLVALWVLCGCSLRRVAGNAPMASDADTQTLIGAGVSTSHVVITVEPPQSASLCGTEQSDPQHPCPSQAAPDQS